jgi:hypothetical protein
MSQHGERRAWLDEDDRADAAPLVEILRDAWAIRGDARPARSRPSSVPPARERITETAEIAVPGSAGDGDDVPPLARLRRTLASATQGLNCCRWTTTPRSYGGAAGSSRSTSRGSPWALPSFGEFIVKELGKSSIPPGLLVLSSPKTMHSVIERMSNSSLLACAMWAAASRSTTAALDWVRSGCCATGR